MSGPNDYLGKFCLWVLFGLLFTGGIAFAAGGGDGADRSADLLDLLYRFMNFALLVIVLFWVFKKVRIGDFFKSRSAEIQKKLEELRNGKAEAERKFREIERKFMEFEKNRQTLIEQFRADGLAEKEAIIAEAKERASQIIEQAELAIQQELKSVKERLQREVVALAAERAEEIIAREITDKDQDRLVDEFIESVRKSH
jgi:F-type H+-transporting ATPase subunit b